MLNDLSFYALAALAVAAAVAAMTLRQLIHCALCAAGAFAGLAGIYFQLGAEFVGAAQVLVYVGAVAILIIFAVLLTRGGDVQLSARRFSTHWLAGVAVSILVLGSLAVPIFKSPSLRALAPAGVSASVKNIGYELMSGCVVPLEATGLLLTAALLGSVVIAMSEKPAARPRRDVNTPRRPELEEATHP